MITDGIDSLNDSSSVEVFSDNIKAKLDTLREQLKLENDEFDEKITNIEFYLNETHNIYSNIELTNMKFPFAFSNNLNIIVLQNNEIRYSKKDYLYFNELIKLNNGSGNLFISKNLNLNYLTNEFIKNVLNKIYQNFECNLKCGHLECPITISPFPKKYTG